MTKKEFINALIQNKEFKTKIEAEQKLNIILKTIENALIDEDEINFINFGKFEITEKKSRICRNPKTGEKIEVEAKKIIKFTPSKFLSETINKK